MEFDTLLLLAYWLVELYGIYKGEQTVIKVAPGTFAR